MLAAEVRQGLRGNRDIFLDAPAADADTAEQYAGGPAGEPTAKAAQTLRMRQAIQAGARQYVGREPVGRHPERHGGPCLLRGQRMADEQGVILTKEVTLQAMGIHQAKTMGTLALLAASMAQCASNAASVSVSEAGGGAN